MQELTFPLTILSFHSRFKCNNNCNIASYITVRLLTLQLICPQMLKFIFF